MRDKRSVKLPRLGKYVLELELEFRDDVRLGRDALVAGLARVTLATPPLRPRLQIYRFPSKQTAKTGPKKRKLRARDEGVVRGALEFSEANESIQLSD